MKAIPILCSLFSLVFIVSAGSWSDWQHFGPCSPIQQRNNNDQNVVDLQEGSQNRSRFCFEDDYGSEADEDEMPPGNCKVDDKETEHRACRIPTIWSKFSAEGKCSVTCGSGKKVKRRRCELNTGALPDDKDECQLGKVDTVLAPCGKRPCAQHGGWSEWSDWGACGSPECHFPKRTDIGGLSYQRRTCSKPIPKYGGKMCDGPFIRIGKCFDPDNCPTDGGWSEWTPWGNWNCKTGTRNRTRACDNPASRNGGRKCEGSVINFFDRLQNSDSYDKSCGIVTTTEKPIPVTRDDESDYDEAEE